MNTRQAAPAAITLLLAILGGALVADEPSSPVPDEVVEAPAAVTERAAAIGKDIQDAAVADPEATEPIAKTPDEIERALGQAESIIVSAGLRSIVLPNAEEVDPSQLALTISNLIKVSEQISLRRRSGSLVVVTPVEHAKFLTRALTGAVLSSDGEESTPDLRLQFTVTKGDVRPHLEALQKSHPDVEFESDGKSVTAYGSVDALESVSRQIMERVLSKDNWPTRFSISGVFIISGDESFTEEAQAPAGPGRPGDGGGIPSSRPSSSGGGRPGVDSDRTEMLFRLSAPDLVSGIRMRVGEEDTKKILDAVQTSNPDVSFEIDGNMIIARGSVADLRTLRSSLLTLGQTEDARDWPPGLQVDVYGWREPRGASPAQVMSEQPTFMHLEHASAANVANVLMKLYPTAGQIVAEPSTNTLILRATREQLEEVTAIVQRLEDAARERRGSRFGPRSQMAQNPDSEIRVYPLRHVLAHELAPTLRELYADNIKVTVNDRANSLLVIASPDMLGRIEDLVRKLDQPVDTTAATGRNDASKPLAAVEAEREYAAAERQAAALALRLKKEHDLGDARKLAETKSALRNLVTEAFEKRQLHQRMELELIRANLKAIQNDIERRERIQEQIIDRRVDELLNPELRWDRDDPPAAPDADALGAAQVPPPLDGIVMRVDKDNLEISLGSDDGLRIGQRLEVFRDDTNLGHAVVQRTVPDRAVAKVDDKTKQGTINVGDRVATKRSPAKSPLPDRGDSGVTLSGAIPPGDSEPSPQGAGRLGTGLASSADVAAAEALLFEAERLLDHTETMVEKGYRKQPDLEEARKQVEAVQAKLRNVRREYEAKTRLLQLDVESAKLKVDAALKALSQSSGPGQTSTEQQFAVRQAELELQRAQTLLALHTGDLGESKDGEQAPQLEAPEQNAGPSEAEAEAAIWRSLGVRVRAMSKVGMPGDRYNGGLIIRELLQDGPAAKAGLLQGDIIIGVGKWETLSIANLLFALKSAETPGDSKSERGAVKVLFLRKAEPRSTTVMLDAAQTPLPADGGGFRPGGQRPVEGDSAASRDAQLWNEYGVTPAPASALTAKVLEWIGLHLRPIGKESFREKNVFANYAGGLDVTFVRSHGPAERAGVHEVDIVARIQGQETLTLASLDSAVQFAVDQIKRGDVDSLQFNILRNGETVRVNIPLPVERLGQVTSSNSILATESDPQETSVEPLRDEASADDADPRESKSDGKLPNLDVDERFTPDVDGLHFARP